MKQWYPRYRYYPSIFLEGRRETIRNVSQDNWFPSRNSNQAPLEYKSDVILLEPTWNDASRQEEKKNFEQITNIM
jgi:hypothetical protein